MSEEPKSEVKSRKLKFEDTRHPTPHARTYELVIPLWSGQIPRAWGIEACVVLSSEWSDVPGDGLVATFSCGARLRATTPEGQAFLEAMREHGYVKEAVNSE